MDARPQIHMQQLWILLNGVVYRILQMEAMGAFDNTVGVSSYIGLQNMPLGQRKQQHNFSLLNWPINHDGDDSY